MQTFQMSLLYLDLNNSFGYAIFAVDLSSRKTSQQLSSVIIDNSFGYAIFAVDLSSR